MTPPPLVSPHSLYRAYLKNLRHIPDPQVWRTHQPYFRNQLDRPRGIPAPLPSLQDDSTSGAGSSSAEIASYAKEARRLRGLKRAKEELNKLRAATACHPHALRRLLEESYGQRGRVRWELINTIVKSGPSSDRVADPPVLAPLSPLKPKPIPPKEGLNRLRPVPDVAIRKAARRAWERDWREVRVPLILPANPEGWKTGWEELGVVESLRILAGIDSPQPSSQSANSELAETASAGSPRSQIPNRPLPRDLPSYPHLPPHIRRLIPKTHLPAPSRDEADTYPRPRPGETRQNPRTWGPPRLLRARLIRRTYQWLWQSLRWVRVRADGAWGMGTYADVVGGLDEGEERKRPERGMKTGRGGRGERRKVEE